MANYVKVVEDTPILSRVKTSAKNVVSGDIYQLWRYSQGNTPSEGVKVK